MPLTEQQTTKLTTMHNLLNDQINKIHAIARKIKSTTLISQNVESDPTDKIVANIKTEITTVIEDLTKILI